jgi:hypothetical protein
MESKINKDGFSYFPTTQDTEVTESNEADPVLNIGEAFRLVTATAKDRTIGKSKVNTKKELSWRGNEMQNGDQDEDQNGGRDTIQNAW